MVPQLLITEIKLMCSIYVHQFPYRCHMCNDVVYMYVIVALVSSLSIMQVAGYNGYDGIGYILRQTLDTIIIPWVSYIHTCTNVLFQ